MENSQGREARFGNMNMTYSRPNELTRDPAPRVVRTIHVGRPATENASTLRTDKSTTKLKGSSLQIAAFFSDHPILAMMVLGLIALIGFALTTDV